MSHTVAEIMEIGEKPVLYIYSGEVAELDEALLEQLGPSHTMTIIPTTPRDVGSARHAAEYFRYSGIRARSLSSRFYRDASRLERSIMSSDAVFLLGGNTYEFLHYARSIGLFAMLERFEEQGGIIASESAGSIILSPDISTAAVPTSCVDENTLGLIEYSAMGRIRYHISPHFDPNAVTLERDLVELQALADQSLIPVILLEDGEGLIFAGEDCVRVVGQGRVLQPRNNAMLVGTRHHSDVLVDVLEPDLQSSVLTDVIPGTIPDMLETDRGSDAIAS